LRTEDAQCYANGLSSAAFVETSYLNTGMCRFESSQSEESRAQSPGSLKVCSKPRVFKCFMRDDVPFAVWPTKSFGSGWS